MFCRTTLQRTGNHRRPLSAAIWLLAFFALAIFSCSNAHAAQITLALDTSDGATGYKIYSGTTSNSYQWVVDVGNVTSYVTADLTGSYTYYFAATAYDASGLESDYSNEISYTASVVSCTYSISPSSASFTAAGGTGSVTVTTQSGCSWTATSGGTGFTITSGSSGTGSGTVSYSVASNSGSSRTIVSTIAGRSFTVTQSGVQTYTITASAGTGGTISPSGTSIVAPGANITYTITPARGRRLIYLFVDGRRISATYSYTFTNVQANHTIRAYFR